MRILLSLYIILSVAFITSAQVRSGMVSREIFSEDGQDSSELIIEYQYFSTVTESYQDTVNTWIRQILKGEEDPGQELSDEFFESVLIQFIADYENYTSEYQSMPWSLEEQVHIDDSYNSFVQLFISGWTYQGGAHGDGFYSVFLFDKKNGARLELDDLFNDVEELTSIGEFYFRIQQEIGEEESLEEVGYDFNGEGFYLNSNFSFTDTGIEFVYNSYEIAPYYMGPSEISIPYQEIDHLLTRKIAKQ